MYKYIQEYDLIVCSIMVRTLLLTHVDKANVHI